jgi:signal transduction histidine kinase
MKTQKPPVTGQTHTSHSAERSSAKIWADVQWQATLLNDRTPQQFVRSRQGWLDFASLQFRLTLGVTTFSVLGLSGLATWTSWKMQQVLVKTHTDNVEQIAERFPYDVALYRDERSVSIQVQQAIDNLFPQNLLLWVTDSDGQVFAQSRSLQTASMAFVDRLRSVSNMPLEPRVYQVEGRYLVLCSTPLRVDGQAIGQLHLAQDITADQLKLNNAMRGLSLVSLLSVLLMATAIALYIRRALRPLRGLSQAAGTISANDLSQAKLSLNYAPTEVRELTETLNAMLSRLARSWEQQKQLIGDISHELRTPLSVAYGSLQWLQRRSANLNETQQEMLETAVTETDRTIQLLKALLELARADSGCIYLHSEKLLLNELVSELGNMARQLKDREVQITAEPDEIWMTTDRNCLSQILMNLIDNAANYSPCNQPILVHLSQTKEQTTIQVRDYGCGLSLEQQTRIFDRFYRVDDARSRATGGTGLGLAIVKTLVESMGGEITVWSEPKQGSMFTVTLPSHLKG